MSWSVDPLCHPRPRRRAAMTRRLVELRAGSHLYGTATPHSDVDLKWGMAGISWQMPSRTAALE